MRGTMISCLIIVVVVFSTEAMSKPSGPAADPLLIAPLEAIAAQQKVLIQELNRLVQMTPGKYPESERLIQLEFDALAAQRQAFTYQLKQDVIAARRDGDRATDIQPLQRQPQQQVIPIGKADKGSANAAKGPTKTSSPNGDKGAEMGQANPNPPGKGDGEIAKKPTS